MKDAHSQKSEHYNAIMDRFLDVQQANAPVDLLPDRVTDVVAIMSVLGGTACMVLVYMLYKRINHMQSTQETEAEFIKNRILQMQLEGFKSPKRTHVPSITAQSEV